MYNSSVYDIDVISINEAVRRQIKRDIDQATAHLKYHISPKGEVLNLDGNCEYCQVYIEEKRILE
ncbi:MAG: hypothetical protein ACJ71F_15760 [Nitrososphaeraceae archaeon]